MDVDADEDLEENVHAEEGMHFSVPLEAIGDAPVVINMPIGPLAKAGEDGHECLDVDIDEGSEFITGINLQLNEDVDDNGDRSHDINKEVGSSLDVQASQEDIDIDGGELLEMTNESGNRDLDVENSLNGNMTPVVVTSATLVIAMELLDSRINGDLEFFAGALEALACVGLVGTSNESG